MHFCIWGSIGIEWTPNCVCAHVCSIYTCYYRCVHVCGGQRELSGVFPLCLYVWRHGLLLSLSTGQAGWPMSIRYLPTTLLVVLVLGLQVQPVWLFVSVLGIQTQVFVFAWQVLYPPNNFPNLLIFNVLRKCWTPVQGNGTILHSYLQWVRAPISLHHQIL